MHFCWPTMVSDDAMDFFTFDGLHRGPLFRPTSFSLAIHSLTLRDQSTTGVGNVSVLLTICDVRVMMTRRDANAGLIICAARRCAGGCW